MPDATLHGNGEECPACALQREALDTDHSLMIRPTIPCNLCGAVGRVARTPEAIAHAFSMSVATAYRAAQTMGLPPRPKGRPVKSSRTLLAEMWAAGVTVAQIAAELGVCKHSVAYGVTSLGLPSRPRGRGRGITRHEFKLRRFIAHMAQTAALEQAAIINAEMADGTGKAGLKVGEMKAREMARAA